jgi:hypothetical protein
MSDGVSDGLPPPDPSQRNQYEPEPKLPHPAEYERLRRVLIAIGGIAMVVFAIGLGAFVLRDNPDNSRPEGVGTAPASSDTAGVAGSLPPVASSGSAPAAPPGEGATTTTAASVATGATTTSSPLAAASSSTHDGSSSAVATAQAFLNALADGRWSDARALNPGRNESDATLQTEYGPLENATIIPARLTAESAGRYDLRFGIVAHEAQPTGHQTVLMCSHWQVDVPDHTILRIASARVRVEGGYVDPTARAKELSATCAALPLK